ncbi:MAG: glycerate kinase [Coleofasciculus sp. Co-bin14]|nr:glycerate kinase [Coleofasciculus sp. Co-bin14]
MLQPNTSVSQILNNWVTGHIPTQLEKQQLVAEELASPQRATAFGITSANVEQTIQARTHLFQAVYPDVLSLPSFSKTISAQAKEHNSRVAGEIPHSPLLLSLWNLWLPLAMQLASSRQQLGRPLIQGILGGQGTGKTTLGAVLRLTLKHLGYHTLSFSLDDLYKTYAERQRLQEQDSRLIWRGPPGTHDIELGLQLLDQLRSSNPANPILVPRFDKSAWGGAGDRTIPEPVENVDIVLFEGWFVGARPIDPAVFDAQTPEPIQSLGDRAFARDMNDQLKDYLPLWERLDRLMILYPTDYRLSQQWRRQAEQEMIATGKSGMTDAQVNEFVEYFWKALHPELFITPLTKNPNLVDLVIEINPDRTPGAVYRPSVN